VAEMQLNVTKLKDTRQLQVHKRGNVSLDGYKLI